MIIGWCLWDTKTNAPFQSTRSAGRWFERKEPIKVYRSEGSAKAQGKHHEGLIAKPVYVEVVDDHSPH